ncbi:MAG: lipid A deacylase LpxR family protein [Nevskia sp.]|nr:lipid A deacylase LpxR family protein [Nevskia sp.]
MALKSPLSRLRTRAFRPSSWLAGAGLALAGAAAPACLAADGADRSGWFTLTAENNNFAVNQDRHYVNGFNFAYLSAPLSGGSGWFGRTAAGIEDALPPLFPRAGQSIDRRFEWTALGQQIFTPSNKSLEPPDPRDRPYAGWLYTGISLLQDRDGRELSDLSATVGVVGPGAFGEQVQNGFHKMFGFGNANGWKHQLNNEPAVTLEYVRKWRLVTSLAEGYGVQADLVPELGAAVGNVFTYAEASALVRVGVGLDADYGPRLMQPGLTGGAYFNPQRAARSWGLNVFGGIQERVVGHNIFLDGNTWQAGPSVDKYPFVHDEVFGVSAFGWRNVRADFTYVRRSREFGAQTGVDRYGSINLTARW